MTVQDLANSPIRNEQVEGIIPLDFSKAFDVDQRLLAKLSYYGVRPNVAEKNILILVEKKKII
jgi:hypothetical protein